MNPLVIVRSLLAVGGAAALIVVVARKFKMMTRDDAPIRVKGGSVTMLSKHFDWDDPDTDDDESEFTYVEKLKQFEVMAWDSHAAWKAWDSGSNKLEHKPVFEKVGKRVVLHVGPPEAEAKVVFRANGLPRVKARKDQLTIDGKELKDRDKAHWPRHVFVRNDGPVGDHAFPNKDGVVLLTPKG